MRPIYSRRRFVTGLGLGAAGFAVGCGEEPAARQDVPGLATDATPPRPTAASTGVPSPTPTSTPTPVPTPTPRPAGGEVREILPGTPWATRAYIAASGVPGPALVVLGGVHGNEPAGWHAADDVATWRPSAGVLAVIPRANTLAIGEFTRLIDGEGDLNRAYPGDPEADLPTSRLAAEFTSLARELEADVLLDLHESWAFFVDREAAGFQNRAQAGTAFLGQTLTAGGGPRGHEIASQIAALVNPSLPVERDHFIPRDNWGLRRAGGNRGTSSLSLGAHVPGLTPVLVETGQRDQDLGWRVELHRAVVRATMDILVM